MHQTAAIPLFAMALAAVACSSTTPTAEGTVLLETSFAPSKGGPPASVGAKPALHEQMRTVGPSKAAEVQVTLHVIQDPASGGQYLKDVKLTVARNGGGEMTAAVAGNAINLGTTKTPLASVPVLISWYRDNGCSKRSGQTMLTLRADGNIELQ